MRDSGTGTIFDAASSDWLTGLGGGSEIFVSVKHTPMIFYSISNLLITEEPFIDIDGMMQKKVSFYLFGSLMFDTQFIFQLFRFATVLFLRNCK